MYNKGMFIRILTLFPEFFTSPLQSSILKRAEQDAYVQFQVVNIRNFTTDKHQTADDRPYGGGPGMVMKVEPIFGALQSVGAHTVAKLPTPTQVGSAEQSRVPVESQSLEHGQAIKQKVILTSAKGKVFTQQLAQEYATLDELIIICGHYEGVDERVAEHLIDEEVRVGDYVLTGGEPAALIMSDAVTRLLPGVLGNEASNQGESHSMPGLLAHPQYTRPEEFLGWRVPEVLLQGHHQVIETWRKQQQKSEKAS